MHYDPSVNRNFNPTMEAMISHGQREPPICNPSHSTCVLTSTLSAANPGSSMKWNQYMYQANA